MNATSKQINDYIINQVIITAQKRVPFTWKDIINSIYSKSPKPYKDESSIEANVYKLMIYVDTWGNPFYDQLKWLQQEGFIELIFQSEGQYILTKIGVKAKNDGGITKYISNQRWKKFISRSKTIILTWLFPAITIFFIIKDGCNRTMTLKQPIKVTVDSLPKEYTINHSHNSYDSATPPINKK